MLDSDEFNPIEPISTESTGASGTPIGPSDGSAVPGGPIGSGGSPGSGSSYVGQPEVLAGRSAITLTPVEVSAGAPVSGPESIFNIGGAPIAILGGVFSEGLPIGGPVTQIFRGGSAPMPNTLFISTITSSGPIAQFFVGSGGAPIGEATFGGGGLAIEGQTADQPTAEIGPRHGLTTDAAVAFGRDRIQRPVAHIGAEGGLTMGSP